MSEDINVTFEAINPSGIKLLNRLYERHLVLNDIGVRLDRQLSSGEELTVPTQEDVDNMRDTFAKSVQVFNEIVEEYSNVKNFAANFGGDTKDFAEKLLSEMKTYNDGIAAIGSTEGGLANYDNDKLNNWINVIMGKIVETNESFNTLIANNK
ncbi:hypothetical protein FC52_GL000069 [Lactobacillus pasteurii DSM 23907 = CRBIP 24.76]|uniref:Uncharacterized protein n=1 Tax=Lactobacillus pasteurii DSM 23907 = CRBIP 24.76 TaxID=1423790 RepID=I7J0K0_9LACO|nr:hypothetical protein [Lactobacillus pasteurii]KRK08376.1 hypothetical protein FC52_GL000069 [Lactobacillus pasteurii DSM 23907 = CRBIP 24.76]TDG75554.1 hypothetical protein C5L33_000439 [Lactobacillus pasteurii]CCI85767.1 Putative uncharacterized protein [Lactobacillus pasteurii DSM 23907 = CRBIP 24.76]